ncbi:Ppx/GppA phosphatase family protein [Sphingomonas nostoxanthinifaciens]|uniref:Ppx/GppA phosphatase family protein n=1 Tax=Sphingomonas nostoxanthinifaciens TaxID=2872652 RepID=UPI001CC1D66D|nr:Ppx/GppA phosphatase family protein [Sphingomonas nostoxanthinifaciens]UAK24783.1 Ppx/GppA family phosphatase [Sphingomonas nostoxanthinifaciens]
MPERATDAAPRRGPRRDAVPPPRAGRAQPQRGTYAALDLGTNNCRLLIARAQGDGFVVIDAFSRIVRLGEGLAASGRLSEAAMDRAVAALAICADKLKRRNVTLVRSVATEACRRATNGRDFVARVRAETGIQLEIITAEQEARLAVTGCQALLEPGTGPALVFDIGGGSTELVLLGDEAGGPPSIEDWFSAPWGVVSLSESEPHIGDDAGELLAAYERMRDHVARAFESFRAVLARRAVRPGRLLGTSGTVTTLASLYLDLPNYDRSAVDGLIVPTDAMRGLGQTLARMNVAERALLPCIGNERADLVVAGCAILEAILDLWPAERLSVADRGIREGILRRLMAHETGERA